MSLPCPTPREGWTHLSLFSGIGGIDLAAHWAGFRTVAFVERDEFCQKVLAKNFPGVPIYNDVTTFSGVPFRGVSLVSGGFPCQDVSIAGFRAGVAGSRSGLYRELVRVAVECGAPWLVVENVANLLRLGHDTVCADLESEGYRTTTFLLRTRLHRRKRVFIVGSNPSRIGLKHPVDAESDRSGQEVPAKRSIAENQGDFFGEVRAAAFVRAGNGVPNRVDRVRALGNAVVPQQVYPILKAIADELREAA